MKLLYLIPHTSTGGLPKFTLKRIESLKDKYDIYLIEYRELSTAWTVQRKQIIEILGDKFISLGSYENETIRDNFISYIKQISPDIIHMEEIPELFMRNDHAKYLYRKNRTYKIFESTHTSTFNVENKKFIPDKFIFVSTFSQKQYSTLNIPSVVVEYPIEKKSYKNIYAQELNFDTTCFNVLNVGLFNENKNQSYVFDIAKKMTNYPIKFHFVGNKADNFKSYWEPLIKNKPDNCIIWNERDDIEKFYQASDLLIHSSKIELNPLVIKEAISYNLPIFMFNNKNYDNKYDSEKTITYLTQFLNLDVEKITNFFDKKENNFKKLLIEEYEKNIEQKPTNENKESINEIISYKIDFTNGARVEIKSNIETSFDVEFIDKNTKNVFKETIKTPHSIKTTDIKYFVDWKVNLYHKQKLVLSHELNLTDKNVFISLESSAMGDTIAWFPYVEEFRKKHNCKIICSTHWNKWFIKEYPDIKFVEPDENITEEIYAKYNIGWFYPWQNTNPEDFKKIPLQKTASDILGLKFKEISPKISTHKGIRTIKDKYVCIAQFSTANAKHWHFPFKNSNLGWQILVDWLNKQGYKVVVISKQKTNLKNIINKTGDFPIEHRINDIKYCEFFIGVGSGLSWLAWALGKKVVMISGFSDPLCEFKSNIINIHNFTVCNGCFNRHVFDKGDWNWCPEQKNTDRQFECTINITPKMVADQIIENKLIENPKPFDFNTNLKGNFILDKNLMSISYKKDENKIVFSYSGKKQTPELSIQIDNFYDSKTYQTLSDVKFKADEIIWAQPEENILEQTDKLRISFFTYKKLFDIEVDIV